MASNVVATTTTDTTVSPPQSLFTITTSVANNSDKKVESIVKENDQEQHSIEKTAKKFQETVTNVTPSIATIIRSTSFKSVTSTDSNLISYFGKIPEALSDSWTKSKEFFNEKTSEKINKLKTYSNKMSTNSSVLKEENIIKSPMETIQQSQTILTTNTSSPTEIPTKSNLIVATNNTSGEATKVSSNTVATTTKVTLSDTVNIVEVPPLKQTVFSVVPTTIPSVQKRKFSFPAALHANLLGLSTDSVTTAPVSTRRRFSNVGDVVSRKLSNTIGWRTLPVPPQEVVAQGKALCCQYIRNRLKRSGIFNKKLGLYRLRSVVGTPSGMIVTEVYPSLVTAGQELERMHPKVYSNVARQASSTPAGVLVSDKAAAALLLAIGRELIKTEITWGKVVAIFAVAGGLAVDCVCQGHPEYLHGLVEGITDLMEEELAEWIAANGGWTSLSAQCRMPNPEITTSAYLSIFGLFIIILFLFCIIFKLLYRLYTL